MSGFVSLVGAGPGDPGLLTVKALHAIKSAEVILYDALVSKEIQTLFPPDAEIFYVGKRMGFHSFCQEKIAEQIISHARRGKRVVRLKGGDPFIFGRGGEELVEIKKWALPYEVIPGVSAALGAACSAEIPLTHRGISDDLRVITGHKLMESAKDFAHYSGTLVLYMASSKATEYANLLLKAGAPPERPLALIENACLPAQVISISTLENASTHGLPKKTEGPGLLIVGDVVKIFHSAALFEDTP